MLDIAGDFDLPPERVWLNAAHQGPLPGIAAQAVAEMVRWKQQPHNLKTSKPFTEIPGRLRSVLADLIAVPDSELVLANSSSYGLHLVANGLDLGEGDEVIVAANDFPSDILPWIRLQASGLKVVQVEPAGEVLSVDEVRQAITVRTKVVCLTWVHSFSGQVTDLAGIGEVSRSVDALFVVNGSQGVGALPISPADLPIDVLTGVGFKWLCGPYGTGFCWLGPRASDRVSPAKLYWLNALTADDLVNPGLDLSTITPSATGRHDIFGTANFFNFAALIESVGLVASTGVARIHEHNLELASHLVDGVDRSLYDVGDRGDPDRLSSIVLLRPLAGSVEDVSLHLETEGVDVAARMGKIRLAPHFYNGDADIVSALAALNGYLQ